ncbi:MAG TPA: DNA methyltransferase, partial [Chloroflexi bacterium]|nr:DNA methyltransferase [Chloroflexota bacterium]
MTTPIRTYLKQIADLTRRGDAREESFYPALKDLLESLAAAQGTPAAVTVLPKQTEAGNPDFRIWDGAYQVIGYIEAKKPGANLERIETSEQLRRYRSTFPNLILTDFYEFRLYREGELLERVSIGRPFVAKKLKAKVPLENAEAFSALIRRFLGFSLPPAFDAETLAVELA